MKKKAEGEEEDDGKRKEGEKGMTESREEEIRK